MREGGAEIKGAGRRQIHPRRRGDYLLNGDTDAKAVASLSHAKVIQQYKEVDQLPADERSTVIKVVAALLRDYRTRHAYAE